MNQIIYNPIHSSLNKLNSDQVVMGLGNNNTNCQLGPPMYPKPNLRWIWLLKPQKSRGKTRHFCYPGPRNTTRTHHYNSDRHTSLGPFIVTLCWMLDSSLSWPYLTSVCFCWRFEFFKGSLPKKRIELQIFTWHCLHHDWKNERRNRKWTSWDY